MKLDTNDRVISVPHTHDLVDLFVGRFSPSGCLQAVRERIFFYYERVIPRRNEGIFEPFKDVTALVFN